MNIQIGALMTLVFLAFSGVSSAAAPKESKISVFKGSYSGSVTYSGGGTSLFGPATGSFSASKKKENGTLTLSSVLGGTAVFSELFTFNKKQFFYTINAAGSAGSGTGSARIGKNKITYTGTFTVGGFPYSLVGTIKIKKKKVTITEVISGNVTIFVNYSLNKKGRK